MVMYVCMSARTENRWNLFDLIVVTISILGLTRQNVPVVTLMRVVRVFRVVKLVRWDPSLRHLINALLASITPVLDSLIIFMLFTSIYAVLATKLFAQQHDEYFGSFSSSLFTMLQMATGDGWYSLVGRQIRTQEGDIDKWASVFFASYTLVVGMALLNIVVAVLLVTCRVLYLSISRAMLCSAGCWLLEFWWQLSQH